MSYFLLGYIFMIGLSCIVFILFAGKEASKTSIGIASIIWPIAWTIIAVISIEKLIKDILTMFVH